MNREKIAKELMDVARLLGGPAPRTRKAKVDMRIYNEEIRLTVIVAVGEFKAGKATAIARDIRKDIETAFQNVASEAAKAGIAMEYEIPKAPDFGVASTRAGVTIITRCRVTYKSGSNSDSGSDSVFDWYKAFGKAFKSVGIPF